MTAAERGQDPSALVAPVVEVLTDLAPLRITFTRDEASSLYNDITVALREMDVDYAGNRSKVNIPALYALYDALYAAGVS